MTLSVDIDGNINDGLRISMSRHYTGMDNQRPETLATQSKVLDMIEPAIYEAARSALKGVADATFTWDNKAIKLKK